MPPRDLEGSTVVVLAGGDPVDPALGALVPDGATVIAADSGLHQAAALNLPVHLVVGDCDSVDENRLAAALDAGAALERYPHAKDRTDLELALITADRLGARRVLVIGGAGGRLDHFLGNALLVASPTYAHLEIEGLIGAARVRAIHDRASLRGEPGDLVTLLALGGPARGVRTTGLLYPLLDEDLAPGSTRGVSNELVDPVATVSLMSGALLAVQPGRE